MPRFHPFQVHTFAGTSYPPVWPVIILLGLFSFSIPVHSSENPGEGQVPVIDDRATRETRYLWENLRIHAEAGLMFGMHDATGYGVGWSGDPDRSDVKDVCGDYPAVYSWDLSGITSGGSWNQTAAQITSAFERGGINTMCWHQLDPRGRGFYAEDVNNERIVETLLPGGIDHEGYKETLETAAQFFKSLRGSEGQSIPVIFRPYHEHDGGWFWWGVGHCTREEYIGLWRFTVQFLRDSLDVHNLLYAYSPGTESGDDSGYLDRYPGDDVVDIFGMDYYFSHPVIPSELAFFRDRIRGLAGMALERNKVAALTEVGQESIPTADWFTRILLESVKRDSLAAYISYAAVWRNANSIHHYAPYPGHASVPDFLEFYYDPYTFFEGDLPEMYAPSGPDITPPVFYSLPESPMTAASVAIEIEVETDERAFLRYSDYNEPYDEMPHEFDSGQGSRFHRTVWTGVQGETMVFYIHAQDTSSNTTKQAAAITMIVDTLEIQINWMDKEYPDTDWPSGAAPLGYPDASVHSGTGTAGTLYFRRHFRLDAVPETLGLLVKCHDGALAYVNGHEIGRSNLEEGQTPVHETRAISTSATNRVFLLDETALLSLRSGDNVMAVEVHAADVQAPNLSFDGQLFNSTAIFVPLGSEWLYDDHDARPPAITLRDILSDIEITVPLRPSCFALHPNHPNPFNPVTGISYSLPEYSEVLITVYDLTGRTVCILETGRRSAGMHRLSFDGSSLESGIYIAELRAGNRRMRQKMMLLK